MDAQIIVDSKLVEQTLGKLKSTLLSWDDSMRAIGAAYKQYYATKAIASRGSVFGKPWPALQTSYAAWKAKKYPGRPILVRSGEMIKNFEFTSTSQQVRVFNPTPYFEKHQKGDGVPQRVSMALNDELKATAAQLVHQDLMQKMRAL